MEVPSFDEILDAITSPEEVELERWVASRIGQLVLTTIAGRRTLAHQIGQVERLTSKRRLLQNPSLHVLDDIDELETVLARMYATMERAQDVSAQIQQITETDWLSYVSRFLEDDVVGMSNDQCDCPLHRFLAWRFPRDSPNLSVGRRRVVYCHEFGGEASRVALPEWATSVACATRAPQIRGRKPIKLRRLGRLLRVTSDSLSWSGKRNVGPEVRIAVHVYRGGTADPSPQPLTFG
jgi:hypothetical protein